MAEPAYRNVRSMVGISPLTGIPPTLRGVDFIADAWDGPVPDRADPLSFYPKRFAGKRFRFFYSPADTVVPTGADARAFAIRFGKVADVELVQCRGDHADPPATRVMMRSPSSGGRRAEPRHRLSRPPFLLAEPPRSAHRATPFLLAEPPRAARREACRSRW
ncbi:hypothetical protein Gbro_1045 [Gordonia bronchialis DSM 43247]|uniref:Uncharacterized protein n=1 Tax=Gordonia bronchialis (strain ATCC 25592 / DSM 43247 / BCRC 13721 / JCM 3198 / KCTC 3076 / NBRC 16047 / NCTC 10667) TaxID=526226 RepID=D0L4D1_GORB4|nr:hypothetical protein [Gordonia bronchialis]ACY20355.1 hypothetical protein Gbro_1045 [Gordonia bronchialis DSM 43247]MCC3323131.1 hypothetical protein [Gordonia bronchialis]QGS25839.1 hypothetical protein FOB84_18625 [Gordonia bronchialis]STQ63159.1 Uncharacterised protein [Gordonia bronchialis]